MRFNYFIIIGFVSAFFACDNDEETFVNLEG